MLTQINLVTPDYGDVVATGKQELGQLGEAAGVAPVQETGGLRAGNLEFINLFLGKYFGRLLGVFWIPKTIKLSRRIRC